jgi:hypothetical protein
MYSPKWQIDNQIGLDVDDGHLVCVMSQNGQWVNSSHFPWLAVEKVIELFTTGELHRHMRIPKTKHPKIQTPIDLSCYSATSAKTYLNQEVIAGRDYGDEHKES